MNLSRSGSTASQWVNWLGYGSGAESNSTGLSVGFDPDLIHIGLLSGANDFWAETPIGDHLDAMDDLVDALATKCPNADFVVSVQPPGDEPGWTAYMEAGKSWAANRGIPCIDWQQLPEPWTETYAPDGVHPTAALPQIISMITAPVILPSRW